MKIVYNQQVLKSYINLLWPIRKTEYTKFFLVSSMMFLILLCSNSIRVLKDSIITYDFGPEAISFIKLWLEIPFGSIFVILYYKLCNIFTTEKIFRLIVMFFLCFYGLFAYLIYPNQEFFHLNETTILYLSNQYPNLKWFILILGKWSITLFYLFGELWPVIIFTFLFWQCANKMTSYEESKRFYPYFNFFGQLNLLFSGYIIYILINENSFYFRIFVQSSHSLTEGTVKSVISFAILLGILILVIHNIIEQKIMVPNNIAKEVLNLSVYQSLNLILKNRLLIRITLMIASYQICVNTIEVVWFSKVQQYYTTSDKFVNYQGKVLFYTGICAIISSLIGGFLIRKYTWLITSILTPVIILIFGTIFFILTIFEKQLESLMTSNEFLVLWVITFVGGLQNAIGKGMKYGVFDITKEILYTPLNNELKTKGKAAVDILGTKFGKAISSCSQFCIFTFFPVAKIDDIVVVLMVTYVIATLIWLITTIKIACGINNDINK